MFERLDRVPDDPILGLMAAFRADSDPKKVGSGCRGCFATPRGTLRSLDCVPHRGTVGSGAPDQQDLRGAGRQCSLQPGHGEAGVRVRGHPVFVAERVRSIQGPGGCGALRLGAELVRLRLASPQATVHVSTPTWANHVPLMTGTRIETRTLSVLRTGPGQHQLRRAVPGARSVAGRRCGAAACFLPQPHRRRPVARTMSANWCRCSGVAACCRISTWPTRDWPAEKMRMPLASACSPPSFLSCWWAVSCSKNFGCTANGWGYCMW